MFSIASTPVKQSVSETISVLSGRLSSATLLEDRRGAILGLRSFAKEYPASVASGALRSLIESLSKDGEDVDTVKVVLETLLMLFNPNNDSAEASEEIALWLADEFTQRQENITLLLDFLETTDFYSRLYSLQLLIAILSARTERTEECVFTAPLGISRLVAVLDDRREAIRNEAITLLTYLTPNSIDLQKLVAFESAFERLFAIINAEGSLLDGGQVIEDCLILLANLLRLNASNQHHFRETGCIPELSKLLQGAYQPEEDGQEVAPWAQAQRNRNIYALLSVIRLFLVRGAADTLQNQDAFWKYHILYHALQLAFSHEAEIPIKAEALMTCADIIRGNPALQENFAPFEVPSPLSSPDKVNGAKTNGVTKTHIIDGLLDLTLDVHSLQVFDVRMAACECLKAYFFKHSEIRKFFLGRAIGGHNAGEVETTNVLTTLLRPPTEEAAGDPYRCWFAAVIMLHLVFDDPSTKDMARKVTEGDEANGEEVVTSIQIITSHLVSSLSRGDDERIVVGYLMLLLCWLFEDLDGVNDLLEEGANIQRLILEASKNSASGTIVQGLCAMLLGLIYEFSTKDSPIPRSTLQPLLIKKLGRDRYIDKFGKLRANPLLRDFEVLPQKLDVSSGQLPDVYFDETFVDFVKDHYSRLLKAIDRDPDLEISVISIGVQKGTSRELVDSLRSEKAEVERLLQELQSSLAAIEQQLGQEREEHRRTRELTSGDLSRIKNVNDTLQKHHEGEIRQIREEQRLREAGILKQVEQAEAKAEAARRNLEVEVERVQKRAEVELRAKEEEHQRLLRAEKQEHQRLLRAEEEERQRLLQVKDEEHQMAVEEFRKQTEDVRKRRQSEADRSSRRAEAENANLKATISKLEVDIMKANKSKTQEMQAAEKKVVELEKKIQEFESKAQETEALLKQKDSEKEAMQGELDDLVMLFADTEDKVTRYQKRLKTLGEDISDGEDEDDDDEAEDGDEDADEEAKAATDKDADDVD